MNLMVSKLRYISGKKLVAHLNIELFELIDYVEERKLTHYDPKSGRPIRTKIEDQYWLEFYLNELKFKAKQYSKENNLEEKSKSYFGLEFHESDARFLRPKAGDFPMEELKKRLNN